VDSAGAGDAVRTDAVASQLKSAYHEARARLFNHMGTIADDTRRASGKPDGRAGGAPGHDDGPRRHGAPEPEMVGMGFFPNELGLPPSLAEPIPRAGEDWP
jgi:hypothetical protein